MVFETNTGLRFPYFFVDEILSMDIYNNFKN